MTVHVAIGASLMVACSTPEKASVKLTDPHALQLVRMVRQDCGSCHGMKLTGGLGPPLTPAALFNMSLDSLVATIYHGRAGIFMFGWKAMISEADVRWIAEQLLNGFPVE